MSGPIDNDPVNLTRNSAKRTANAVRKVESEFSELIRVKRSRKGRKGLDYFIVSDVSTDSTKAVKVTNGLIIGTSPIKSSDVYMQRDDDPDGDEEKNLTEATVIISGEDGFYALCVKVTMQAQAPTGEDSQFPTGSRTLQITQVIYEAPGLGSIPFSERTGDLKRSLNYSGGSVTWPTVVQYIPIALIEIDSGEMKIDRIIRDPIQLSFGFVPPLDQILPSASSYSLLRGNFDGSAWLTWDSPYTASLVIHGHPTFGRFTYHHSLNKYSIIGTGPDSNPINLGISDTEVPLLDEQGNPVIDYEGNPVYENVLVKGCILRTTENGWEVYPPDEDAEENMVLTLTDDGNGGFLCEWLAVVNLPPGTKGQMLVHDGTEWVVVEIPDDPTAPATLNWDENEGMPKWGPGGAGGAESYVLFLSDANDTVEVIDLQDVLNARDALPDPPPDNWGIVVPVTDNVYDGGVITYDTRTALYDVVGPSQGEVYIPVYWGGKRIGFGGALVQGISCKDGEPVSVFRGAN